MKLEKKYSRVETADVILFSLLMFSMYILMLLGWLIIFERKFTPFKDTAIMWAFFPVLYTWAHSALNRNGVMTISDFDQPTPVLETIEAAAVKLNFLVAEKTDTKITFDKKSRWSRFFNIFLRENLRITLEGGNILIHAKKNILNRIEFRLKRDFHQNTSWAN